MTKGTRGGTAQSQFKIYNAGDDAGENCRVEWYSGDAAALAIAAGKEPSESAVSSPFGLPPKQTTEISLSSLPYQHVGTFSSRAYVVCGTMRSMSPVAHDHEVTIVDNPEAISHSKMRAMSSVPGR